MTGNREAAIELLNQNLTALPHPEYGVINVLPFAHDSEQTRQIRRHVCEGVVDLLKRHGLIKDDAPQQVPANRSFTITCETCGGLLVSVPVDASGMAKVNAENYIRVVGRLNPDCEAKHREITVEDIRRHMEREFYNDPATKLAQPCQICKAIEGQLCRDVKGYRKINGIHEERGQQPS